jgi:hypothetical protein
MKARLYHIFAAHGKIEEILRVGLLGKKIVEGLYCGEFVVFNVKHGVELRDIQNVMDLLGKVEQLEISACVADSGKAADQLTDAGGIDKIDICKVKDDLLLTLGDKIPHRLAQALGLVTQSDPAFDIDDSDVTDFARSDSHRLPASKLAF